MTKYYFVYILASKRNGTLYVGMTNDLKRRGREHKSRKALNFFTSRYKIEKLVYYEKCNNKKSAIKKEKQMKKWKRKWKLRIIEEFNLEWKDLYNNF